MSELKEYLCIEARMIESNDFLCYRFTSAAKPAPQASMEPVYLKSEADKVIAEKYAEIAELKAQVHDYAQGLYVMQSRAEMELRHHKYKRCLAMAMWCEAEADAAFLRYNWDSGRYDDVDFYKKWHKRWLALAEEPTWAKFLQLIHKENQ